MCFRGRLPVQSVITNVGWCLSLRVTIDDAGSLPLVLAFVREYPVVHYDQKN